MAAAILQGVPATTLDTDIWIDLPSRQYMRVIRLCLKLDAKFVANTVVALSDDSLVNFVYSVGGLKSFDSEYKRARRVKWNGMEIPVLPLERIIASKESIRRPKDIAHLPLLKQVLNASRKVKR
jgi:hypothetical protein